MKIQIYLVESLQNSTLNSSYLCYSFYGVLCKPIFPWQLFYCGLIPAFNFKSFKFWEQPGRQLCLVPTSQHTLAQLFWALFLCRTERQTTPAKYQTAHKSLHKNAPNCLIQILCFYPPTLRFPDMSGIYQYWVRLLKNPPNSHSVLSQQIDPSH